MSYDSKSPSGLRSFIDDNYVTVKIADITKLKNQNSIMKEALDYIKNEVADEFSVDQMQEKAREALAKIEGEK